MRIAILTTQCPFVVGGAELHARNLERALREAGHEAEIVTMPFKWYPSATILDHMLAARLLDVSEFNGVPIDLAICLKFPAYLMQHPNKVYWILHQHRQAYDLWDSGHTDLFDDPDGRMVRDAIIEADNNEFRRAKHIFANSANVAKRLWTYNTIKAEPLYHPPPLAGRLHTGPFGDYFYYPSRIAGAKRQDFVLRALAKTKSTARVVFSGAPDNPAYGEELRKLAQDLGVADRVTWKGFVSDAEMIDLYAGARGVLFTPIDEDLGYIALEAMLAGKPLLTLSDSGEPAALIRDAQEGCITAPEPAAFADAMDRLTRDPKLAGELGAAGLERYRSLDISWAHAVDRLTSKTSAPSATVQATDVAPLTPVVHSMRVPSDPIAAKASNGRPDWTQTDPASTDVSLSRLAESYDFGAHLKEHGAYYDVHWPRYLSTLDALRRSGIHPNRILEVGTSAPYVFSTCLRSLFPDAQITAVQEHPAGLRWQHVVKAADPSLTDLTIDVHGANVETTSLPFEDQTFDIVVAMEIVEHFAIDPSYFFREAQRVLRDDGLLLVTTPNMVSSQNVARAIRGASPYSFGVFVPWNGAYGRHNREYTPREVESLGRYAGLETLVLETADLYPADDVPASVTSLIADSPLPAPLRGQNILYVGRKSPGAHPAAYPTNLFPVDPGLFDGHLELLSGASAGQYVIRVTNRSRLIWNADQQHRVCLSVDRVDQAGQIQLDVLRFDLPTNMGIGSTCDVVIDCARGSGLASAWFEIGLFAEGAGPFKGTGRTPTVCIFADQISVSDGSSGGQHAD